MAYRVLLYSCGLFLATLAHAAAPPAEKVPTTDQIYASFESADYPRALRQIAAALALKGDAALQYDRHELLTLKGEALVRLKSFREAADAFDDAAKATVVETKAAVDRSTAEVLRRARSGVYTPAARKGAAAPASFDVTDPLKRPEAFAALFEDCTPKVEGAVKAALASGKMPAMLDAFRMLRDLRMVEQAAAGADERTAALARPLTSRARSVMAKAVAEMSARVTQIEDPEQQEEYKVGPCGELLRRDYTGELQDIALDCERAERFVADLLKYIPGDEAGALATLRDDAAGVASRARSLADAQWVDYGISQIPAEWQDRQQPENVGPDGRRRGGTNSVQRPDPAGRNAGTAANRGVDTGGRR